MQNNPIPTEIKRKIYSWIRGAALGTIGYAVLLMLAAGKWDWVWGWVFIILFVLAIAAHVLVLVPINPAPEGCVSRMPNAGTSGWHPSPV